MGGDEGRSNGHLPHAAASRTGRKGVVNFHPSAPTTNLPAGPRPDLLGASAGDSAAVALVGSPAQGVVRFKIRANSNPRRLCPPAKLPQSL
ncbi:MAG: hypothetical protein ACE5HI_16690 [bacterium]